MPGSAIPLGVVELIERTAVSLKFGLRSPSQRLTTYKIPQNLGGILHSLGVFREPILNRGSGRLIPVRRGGSATAVEPVNAAVADRV